MSDGGMSEGRLQHLKRLYSLTGFYGPEGAEMLNEIDRLKAQLAEREDRVNFLEGELRGTSDEIEYQVERFKKRGGEIDALERERDALKADANWKALRASEEEP